MNTIRLCDEKEGYEEIGTLLCENYDVAKRVAECIEAQCPNVQVEVEDEQHIVRWATYDLQGYDGSQEAEDRHFASLDGPQLSAPNANGEY